MNRTTTPRQQAGRQRLGYLTATVTLIAVVLLAFSPALFALGTGVTSAVVWCRWLDAQGEEGNGERRARPSRAMHGVAIPGAMRRHIR